MYITSSSRRHSAVRRAYRGNSARRRSVAHLCRFSPGQEALDSRRLPRRSRSRARPPPGKPTISQNLFRCLTINFTDIENVVRGRAVAPAQAPARGRGRDAGTAAARDHAAAARGHTAASATTNTTVAPAHTVALTDTRSRRRANGRTPGQLRGLRGSPAARVSSPMHRSRICGKA